MGDGSRTAAELQIWSVPVRRHKELLRNADFCVGRQRLVPGGALSTRWALLVPVPDLQHLTVMGLVLPGAVLLRYQGGAVSVASSW